MDSLDKNQDPSTTTQLTELVVTIQRIGQRVIDARANSAKASVVLPEEISKGLDNIYDKYLASEEISGSVRIRAEKSGCSG